jgi:hypothetical protein
MPKDSSDMCILSTFWVWRLKIVALASELQEITCGERWDEGENSRRFWRETIIEEAWEK